MGRQGSLCHLENVQQLTGSRNARTTAMMQMTLGQQGRERVVEHFSLHRMVHDYQLLYESLMRGQRA